MKLRAVVAHYVLIKLVVFFDLVPLRLRFVRGHRRCYSTSPLQILVLSALAVACLAAPQQDATILRYDNDNIGIDGYKYGYETSNGISHDEEGQLQNIGSENEAINVQGSYKYTDEKSGKVITVTYVSGENGFRPQVTIS